MSKTANLSKERIENLVLAAEAAVSCGDSLLSRCSGVNPMIRQPAVRAMRRLADAARIVRECHGIALGLDSGGKP